MTVFFSAMLSVPSTRLGPISLTRKALRRRRNIADAAALATIGPHFRSSHHVAVHQPPCELPIFSREPGRASVSNPKCPKLNFEASLLGAGTLFTRVIDPLSAL